MLTIQELKERRDELTKKFINRTVGDDFVDDALPTLRGYKKIDEYNKRINEMIVHNKLH